MSMFILFNTEDNLFMGCYSTLDKAKEAYEKFVLESKGERIPDCRINKVKVDAPAYCFFGGYTFEAEWIRRFLSLIHI
jgi:hypothetical protein